MAHSASPCDNNQPTTRNFRGSESFSASRARSNRSTADEEVSSVCNWERCGPPEFCDLLSFEKQATLEGASLNILYQFDCLMDKLKRGIEVTDHTTHQIVTHLESIANCDYNDKHFADVFRAFRRQVKFYHYNILLEITHKLLPTYTDEVKEYEGKLRTYFLERIFPLPKEQRPVGHSTVDNNQKILVIKLDRELEGFTLEDFERDKKNIASLLNMSESALTLQNISKGCVCLQFGISESDSQKIAALRVTRSIARGFDEAGIIYIQSDTHCVFDNMESHLDQQVVVQPIEKFAVTGSVMIMLPESQVTLLDEEEPKEMKLIL